MRKRILLVIAACLLLTGCGDAGPAAVKADPAAGKAPKEDGCFRGFFAWKQGVSAFFLDKAAAF